MRGSRRSDFEHMLLSKRRALPSLPQVDGRDRFAAKGRSSRAASGGSSGNLRRLNDERGSLEGCCSSLWLTDGACRLVVTLNLLPALLMLMMVCTSSVSFMIFHHRAPGAPGQISAPASLRRKWTGDLIASIRDLEANRSLIRARDRVKDGDKGGIDGDMVLPELAPAVFNFSKGSGGGQRCVAFRATSLCSPGGRRLPHRDRKCHEPLGRGQSGYCELIDAETGAPGSAMPLFCNSLSKKAQMSWAGPRPSKRGGTRGSSSASAQGRRGPSPSASSSAQQQRSPWVPTCDDVATFASFEADSVSYRAPWQEPGPSRTIPGSRAVIFSVADRLMVSAYAAVRLLRSQGCGLPIELWFFAGEVRLSELLLEELVLLYGVSTHEIAAPREALCPSSSDSKCFATKPYILFHTRYEQVLLLDTDNFPVRDPTYLFDSAEFRATGAVFWPDFWSPANTLFNIHPRSALWPLTGLRSVDMFEQESSAVLVDRSRAFSAPTGPLDPHQEALSQPMGSSNASSSSTYSSSSSASSWLSPLDILMFYARPGSLLLTWSLVYGDKDLFRLAWMKAKRPYHMMARPPGMAGQSGPDGFCGNTMVQYDAEGRAAFLHRNTCKIEEGWRSRRIGWAALQEYVGPETTSAATYSSSQGGGRGGGNESSSGGRPVLHPWQDAEAAMMRQGGISSSRSGGGAEDGSNATLKFAVDNDPEWLAASRDPDKVLADAVNSKSRSVSYRISPSPFTPRHGSQYSCGVCYWVPLGARDGFRIRLVGEDVELAHLEDTVLGFARDAALSVFPPGVYEPLTRNWWGHLWLRIGRWLAGTATPRQRAP